MYSLLDEPLRTCIHCGLKAKNTEDLSMFVSSRKNRYGHQNCCLKCRAKHSKKWRKTERGHLLKVYTSMIDRCYKKIHKSFKGYGGLGIKVCENWLNNKEVFLKWAIESGYKRGLWLDRINNNECYSPDNCRWVTPKESAYNRTTTIFDKNNKTIKCRSCKKTKSFSEFHRDITRASGYRSICKKCRKEIKDENL